MMRRIVLIAGLAVMLTGCAVGIQPGKDYPSETFTVPITYQEAYRRADAELRQCLPSLTTAGNLYTDNKTGVVRASSDNFEAINVHVAQADDETLVKITVWGVGLMDKSQISATKKAIQSGVIGCRIPKYEKQ